MTTPSDDGFWIDAAKRTLGRATVPDPNSNLSVLYSAMMSAQTESAPPPRPEFKQPPKTSSLELAKSVERFEKRAAELDKESPIKTGRAIPGHDDLKIGSGRQLTLAILFLDICKFSQIASGNLTEQSQVLKLLNFFVAEMLYVVREHGGEFEKNTGDGIMAYFAGSDEEDAAQRAVHAAVTMHCYYDQAVSPRLTRKGIPTVKFRVGIDIGEVTLANVGIAGGDHRSVVAIGTAANVACKLMTLIPEGGIAIGNAALHYLPLWRSSVRPLGGLSGFVMSGSTTPYPAWEVTYRVPSQQNTIPLPVGLRSSF